jgi:hypothetical protein
MLVPKDYLLRKIDGVIDFDFVRGKIKDLYCSDNGRPAVDPVVLFKMLFLGCLFAKEDHKEGTVSMWAFLSRTRQLAETFLPSFQPTLT